MTKHTPLPWTIDPTGDIGAWHIGSREYGPVVDLCDPMKGDQEANARFIVRACNSYEELVEAAKRALEAMESAWHELENGKATIGSQFIKREDMEARMGIVQAAIAKAKGES